MAARRMSVIIGPDKWKVDADPWKMEAECKATEERDPQVAQEAQAVAEADAADYQAAKSYAVE